MSRRWTNLCAVPGCGATIPSSFLMCREHWANVPKHLQLDVYHTWRHGAGVRSAEYKAARARAVAYLSPNKAEASR